MHRLLCMHKRSLVYTQEILLCIHNYAKLCETMRNYTKLCETMRNYAKLCETMRNHAKLCETNAKLGVRTRHISKQGPLKGPLGYLGGALECPRRFYQICRKLDAQFRANVSICTRLHIESSLPELARCARGADGARGNGVTERCSDPPFSRAGG